MQRRQLFNLSSIVNVYPCCLKIEIESRHHGIDIIAYYYSKRKEFLIYFVKQHFFAHPVFSRIVERVAFLIWDQIERVIYDCIININSVYIDIHNIQYLNSYINRRQ